MKIYDRAKGTPPPLTKLSNYKKGHEKQVACSVGIRLCHTAAILSGETKIALFYHAEPRSQNRGGEAKRGKTKLFGLPGQYGRCVTKANVA